MESYTTSKRSTNTSVACDTPSIKVDITDTMVYAITLCKLLEFILDFWLVTMQNDNIIIRPQCYYNPPIDHTRYHVTISCLL